MRMPVHPSHLQSDYPLVVCITDFWLPKFGGMERSIENLCRELPTDCGATVLTEGSSAQQRNEMPFHVERLCANGKEGYFRRALRWIGESRSPRVLHIFGFSYYWPEAQAQFIESCRHLRDTAIVMKVPTLGDASRYIKTTHAMVARSVDRFIALTGAMQQELVACGVPVDRVVCMPNGVMTTRFTPAEDVQRRVARTTLGLPHDRLLLGFSGRFEVRKRIDLLAAAIKSLSKERRPCLVLVGEPDHTFGTGFEVSMLLDGDIFWLPRQPDMRPVYHALDAYITASNAEGMSNSVLESMASGLPIIASDIAGHRELVRDGVNGFLFENGNRERLVEAIEKLIWIWNAGDLMAMRTSSRERAVAEFDQALISRRYSQLYLELTALERGLSDH
jgi:glycosyltransferase involved in cell wall biosynthesis